MIHAIRNIQEIKQGIEKIKLDIEDLKKEQDSLKEAARSLQQETGDLASQIRACSLAHQELVSSVTDTQKDLSTVLNDLKKEVSDFRLMPTQLQEKVLLQSKQDMASFYDNVRIDMSKYHSLKEEVLKTNSSLGDLKASIERFQVIAKTIKEQDFQLVKFTAQVERLEKEKYELEKKVDTMERLVSSMRRRS
ncbi:hypothetical protein J4460_08425 [Candidatus Woesearchaeota archaeon]|nr:MAG: hypothetical protein QS99_C0012G0015 [archaeon GW2011_AR4]MBS3130663.1 hypothetical protein [Candidatus Woesearchaeota archaeon]HIH37942.1 hypothetical protein [Candidatus Woesearchaeota archaeon]HIH48634.1 hypothetical protein [Candidatus Woesearchaeota archaeon]HIJ03721.1 hypothetical protein [Candidatus Woesearchaeota archaeon]